MSILTNPEAYPQQFVAYPQLVDAVFADGSQATNFLADWKDGSYATLRATLEAAIGAEPTDEQEESANNLLILSSAYRMHQPVFCNSCEHTYNPRAVSMHRTCDGDRLCADCSQDWVYAEDTGEFHPDSDSLYFHHSDESYRTYPEEDEESEEALLYQYGTDVIDVHGWPSATPTDSLCFGVELECEPKRGHSQASLADALGGRDGNGRYILKADGSLDYGAELVTLPYTLDFHREQFGWARILDSEVASVGKSGAGTTNCGIHIHVNRAALSPLTIGKVLVFLNSADNVNLVTCIAQRSSNSYCSRDYGKKLTDIHGGSRYDLLNVSGGPTIEFRLFRGNLRAERVLKNLEFCHALIRFCENSGIKASASGSKFLAWVEQRARQYPHLVAFLREHGKLRAAVAAPDAAPVAVLSDI